MSLLTRKVHVHCGGKETLAESPRGPWKAGLAQGRAAGQRSPDQWLAFQQVPKNAGKEPANENSVPDQREWPSQIIGSRFPHSQPLLSTIPEPAQGSSGTQSPSLSSSPFLNRNPV